MTSTCKSDLVDGRAKWLLWGIPFGLIVLGSLSDPLRPWLWTPSFAVAGIACVVNASNCQRTHCFITGPLFILAAIASALKGGNLLGIDWMWIGVGAAVGTYAAYQFEWLKGKYSSKQVTPPA